MKKEQRTVDVYVADDGEEFDNERRCLLHEILLKGQPSVLKNAVYNITDVEDEPIEIFPIASQDDYDIVCLAAGGTYPMPLNDTFAQYGRGWYMVHNYSDGYYSVINLNKYIGDKKKELNDWIVKVIMKTSSTAAFKRDGDA